MNGYASIVAALVAAGADVNALTRVRGLGGGGVWVYMGCADVNAVIGVRGGGVCSPFLSTVLYTPGFLR